MSIESLNLLNESLPLLFAQAAAQVELDGGNSWARLIHPENLALIVTIALPLLIGLVAVVGGIWHQHQKNILEAALKEQELLLKRDMIERGMSAQEIQAVLGTSSMSGKKKCSTAAKTDSSETVNS